MDSREHGSGVPGPPPGEPGGPGPDQDAFDELGRLLLRGRTLEEVLSRLTELVAATVSGADQVSLTLTGDGGARTAASSGPLAVDLDHVQYRLGSGPCLDAAHDGAVVRVPDTADDIRYPEFAAAAQRAGVRSSFSVGLPGGPRAPGALNLYRVEEPDDVDEEGARLAELFASFAAVALVNAAGPDREHRVRYVHVAMRNRAVLDQATGVVMARESCDAEQAYDRLVAAARAQDRPLLEVAAAVVADLDRGGPPGAP